MIRIGDKINGRYRLTSRIAQGGTAEVYEAVDLINKKQCAVKFIKENLLTDQKNVNRFAHEEEIVKRLSHENIIQVYDSGIFNYRPYIILEYIKGQTLGEKLKLGSKITYLEACEIIAQLCSLLNYIHTRGIIHRDIKPDNIYYCYDGTIKLGDFGIAMDLTRKSKEDEALIGSVHYLAPEVCRGEEVSKASDIYSLGLTFYELVTRRLPFMKGDVFDVALSQVQEDIPSPCVYAPDLPKPIESIIMKATMKNPSDRYKSAKEMRDDLLLILSDKKKYRKRKNIFQKIFGFIED